MSVDFSAITVLGIKLDESDLSARREVRGCEHSVPDDAAYCPACGKKVRNTVVSPISILDRGSGKLGSFDLTSAGPDCGPLIVGAVLGEAGEFPKSMRCYDPTKLDAPKVKEELRELLEPLGIFKEDTFGLWTILECS